MATVRKVQSRLNKDQSKAPAKTAVPAEAKTDTTPTHSRAKSDAAETSSTGVVKAAAKTKKCAFCTTHTEPLYWDSAALRKFISDRGRIIPRSRSGACAKHQRRVSKQIKYARHLSLLPFIVRA